MQKIVYPNEGPNGLNEEEQQLLNEMNAAAAGAANRLTIGYSNSDDIGSFYMQHLIYQTISTFQYLYSHNCMS